MKIRMEELAPFREICRKICLNIPSSCRWHWDPKRSMAVVVLEGEDAEMVFFPLFKEFRDYWNFSSVPPETEGVTEWVNNQFGLMPGQVVFTSYPLCNLVLCVAWWPWGDENKVSMRVGLIPTNRIKLREQSVWACLQRWLNIPCVRSRT